MKNLKSLLALAMFSFLLVSCTQDSELTEASLDLTAQVNVPIKDQKANVAFDSTDRGLYQGFFSSGTAQSNGKIWINLGNDGQFNALVEIDGGGSYNFELASTGTQDANPDVYRFANANGSFVFNVTNPLSPFYTQATLNGMIHLGNVVKVTSQRVPVLMTGTFDGDLSGTWNLMGNGGIANGIPDTELLTSVEVTYIPGGGGPIMKTDTVFETIPGGGCFLGGDAPYTGGFDPCDISANGQTSDFGSSTPGSGALTDWSIDFKDLFGGYQSTSCGAALTGTWSRDSGTAIGTITIGACL